MSKEPIDKDKQLYKKFKIPFALFFTTSIFMFFLYPQLKTNKLLLVIYLIASLIFLGYYFWYKSKLK
jgi:hypothetical protein